MKSRDEPWRSPMQTRCSKDPALVQDATHSPQVRQSTPRTANKRGPDCCATGGLLKARAAGCMAQARRSKDPGYTSRVFPAWR
eukprot:15134023-Alexandrium_andersonii.AAC.1